MTRIKLDEVQTITGTDGRPTHAVIPWSLWTEIAGMIDSDEALFRGVDPREETFPAEIAKRLVAGENAVKVFREHRGTTQAELARRVGSSAAYISQIETGTRRAGGKMLRLIARALDVDYEDIALPALPNVEDTGDSPQVRDMPSHVAKWNSDRMIVSCMFSIDGAPQYVSVSLEALADIEHTTGLTGPDAVTAFERHRERIRAAAAQAVAEGRRQRDGVLLLVSADF